MQRNLNLYPDWPGPEGARSLTNFRDGYLVPLCIYIRTRWISRLQLGIYLFHNVNLSSQRYQSVGKSFYVIYFVLQFPDINSNRSWLTFQFCLKGKQFFLSSFHFYFHSVSLTLVINFYWFFFSIKLNFVWAITFMRISLFSTRLFGSVVKLLWDP